MANPSTSPDMFHVLEYRILNAETRFQEQMNVILELYCSEQDKNSAYERINKHVAQILCFVIQSTVVREYGPKLFRMYHDAMNFEKLNGKPICRFRVWESLNHERLFQDFSNSYTNTEQQIMLYRRSVYVVSHMRKLCVAGLDIIKLRNQTPEMLTPEMLTPLESAAQLLLTFLSNI